MVDLKTPKGHFEINWPLEHFFWKQNTISPGTNGGGIWNPDRNDHASYRRQASVTLEFTITEPGDEFEDDTEPETEVKIEFQELI